MRKSLFARLGFVGVLACVLTIGAFQIGSAPVEASSTCVCPAQIFPGCSFTNSYTFYVNGRQNKCCVYSCGIEYCGIDGPGPC